MKYKFKKSYQKWIFVYKGERKRNSDSAFVHIWEAHSLQMNQEKAFTVLIPHQPVQMVHPKLREKEV